MDTAALLLYYSLGVFIDLDIQRKGYVARICYECMYQYMFSSPLIVFTTCAACFPNNIYKVVSYVT